MHQYPQPQQQQPQQPHDQLAQQMAQQNAILAEHLRLAKRADRRSGCMWNIVMTLLFGVWYWAWLLVKWTAKASFALTLVAWRLTLIAARWSWQGTLLLARWSYTACKQGYAAGRLAYSRAIAAIAERRSATAAVAAVAAVSVPQAIQPPSPVEAPVLPTSEEPSADGGDNDQQ